MTDRKMLEQRKRLRSLQRRFPGMWLMHGTELNIGPEGEVDWSREFLRGFDITVASVHSHFGQSRAQMTRRLIRAMENPCVNVIGHPTTRKLGRRGPVDLDLGAVFAASARTGTALEINAHPQRLDLGDELVFLARRHGVKFAVSTDAHGVADLEFMELGVACAQRGWLTKDEVINAWPRSSLRRFLRKEPLSGG
jgi:DNA polymerase (family 10)